MAWILRLVNTGAEDEGPCTDVMEIDRPDDLVDIASLGLTLAEAKRLLAGVQQEIVAAQAKEHAVRRPDCSRCGGACRVKDYREHAVATLFGQVTVRLARFRCAACGGIEAGVGWPPHCRSTPELDRLTAAHHPLFGQLATVVRRRRSEGEPCLVIEGLDGGRQLLPARYAEPAGTAPVAAVPALVFTPGSLRALAALVATLRDASPPIPETCHAPRPEPATGAAVEQLPARNAPAPGPALDRPAAAPAASRTGRHAHARRTVP